MPHDIIANTSPEHQTTALSLQPTLAQLRTAHSDRHELSKEVVALLARAPFKEAAQQLDLKALIEQLSKELQLVGVMEHLLARDLCIHQVNLEKYRRAITTHLILIQDRAVREMLLPGSDYFAMGSPGYDPPGDRYGGYQAAGGTRLDSHTPEQALAQAKAKLAAEGITETGITDAALVMALPTVEALDKLAASAEARRDRIWQDLSRLVARRQLATNPQVVDAEFVSQ